MITRLARRINARLMALTQSTELIHKSGIDAWRERIYSFILRGLVVFGFLAALPSIWLSWQAGLYGLAIFNALAYALILALVILRDIAYEIRALIIVLLAYAVGLVVYLATGSHGAGLFWLFTVPPLASLLLGLAYGAFFLGLNALTLAGIGYLIVSQAAFLPGGLQMNLMTWVVVSANFLASIPLRQVNGGIMWYVVWK